MKIPDTKIGTLTTEEIVMAKNEPSANVELTTSSGDQERADFRLWGMPSDCT